MWKPSSIKISSRGFTLIETAIVLAIVALIIAGIWAATVSVKKRMDEEKFFRDLMHIVNAVRGKFTPQQLTCGTHLNYSFPSYNDLYNPALKIFPVGDPRGQRMTMWGAPTISVVCGNAASSNINYIRFTWYAYDDFDYISRDSCRRVMAFIQRSLPKEDVIDVMDCDWPWWTGISFSFTLPRRN